MFKWLEVMFERLDQYAMLIKIKVDVQEVTELRNFRFAGDRGIKMVVKLQVTEGLSDVW